MLKGREGEGEQLGKGLLPLTAYPSNHHQPKIRAQIRPMRALVRICHQVTFGHPPIFLWVGLPVTEPEGLSEWSEWLSVGLSFWVLHKEAVKIRLLSLSIRRSAGTSEKSLMRKVRRAVRLLAKSARSKRSTEQSICWIAWMSSERWSSRKLAATVRQSLKSFWRSCRLRARDMVRLPFCGKTLGERTRTFGEM